MAGNDFLVSITPGLWYTQTQTASSESSRQVFHQGGQGQEEPVVDTRTSHHSVQNWTGTWETAMNEA